MRLEDFNYDLDPALIAQHPCGERDHSRMMTVDRGTGRIENRRFFDLPGFLKAGDVIVVNDSRVIPARLFGRKATGAVIEILLLESVGPKDGPFLWEALIRPGKRVRAGSSVGFEDGSEAVLEERVSDKKWRVRFRTETPFEDFLQKFGRTPLPPYIRRDGWRDQQEREPGDRDRYQTIYARVPGSVAAPTAGLHFSEEVLTALKSAGVRLASVTLHVGLGTFLPIETKRVEDHRMQEEAYEIGPEAAEAINCARRVIAVGTTSTRTIESAADGRGRITPGAGRTGLYIYPGYRFKRIDGLVTNFHLPKSSLFLLVSAFGGTDLIRRAYAEAIAERYRFYSYGDCMLIL